MGTVTIDFRRGRGGLFDRVQWRCNGRGDGCGVWYATADRRAPFAAEDHLGRAHQGRGHFVVSPTRMLSTR